MFPVCNVKNFYIFGAVNNKKIFKQKYFLFITATKIFFIKYI